MVVFSKLELVIICQFIEIIDASDSVNSIPEASVLKAEKETFVLTFKKEDGDLFYLSKSKVTTGRRNNGFVEITEIPESKKILIKGVYNLRIE